MDSQGRSNAGSGPAPIEVRSNLLSRLDRIPLTRSMWAVIVLIMAVWIVESFDQGIIGTTVLTLTKLLQLTPSQVGLYAISSVVGVAFGALFSGPLVDRFGRRTVLIWTLTLTGIFTALGGIFLSYAAIVFFRFASGVFVGATLPIPYIMMSETNSTRLRGASTGIGNSIINVGFLIPILVGAWAVAAFPLQVAWRVPFLVGIVPLLIVIPVILWLPESPRFLLNRGRVDRVRAFVEQLETQAGLPHDETLVDPRIVESLTEGKDRLRTVRTLLHRPYPSRMWWAALPYTGVSFIVLVIITYVALIVHGEGFSSSQALLIVGGVLLIGAPGCIVQGFLADRWGRKPIFGLYLAGTLIGLALMIFSSSLVVIFIGLVLLGWFGTGGPPVGKVYNTEQFPTRLRGTGVSMIEFFMRIVAAAIVYVIPMSIAAWGRNFVLILVGLLMALFILPTIAFGRETARVSLEENGSASVPEVAVKA